MLPSDTQIQQQADRDLEEAGADNGQSVGVVSDTTQMLVG